MRIDFMNQKTRWGFFIGGLFCLFTAFGLVTAFSGRFAPYPEEISPKNEPSEFVRQEEEQIPKREKTTGEETKWVVYVTGAVLRPGVYEIKPESRVNDAIAASGGFSAQADPEALNLAAKLTDGEHIKVPGKAETSNGNPPQDSKTERGRAGKININTATAAELQTLPGIGPKLSAMIVDYRENNSPSKRFKNIEELRAIKGIGARKFEAVRDFITVD